MSDIAVMMDSPERCQLGKDSSIALMAEAQRRKHRCYYISTTGLTIRDHLVWARAQEIEVLSEEVLPWYRLGAVEMRPLHTFDGVLMREDPPFDMDYIFTTYLLSMAQEQGASIINVPWALRNANEKLITTWFPELVPDTVVSSQACVLKEFITEQSCAVLKPLDSMGGDSIFRVVAGDPNVSVMIDAVTQNGRRLAMTQTFIDSVLTEGDKRILLIHGEPIPFALVRKPAADDFRGNLAQGASATVQPLTERDKHICASVKDRLLAEGLLLVGLDVIGDYLTEVNITSPTGFCELKRLAPCDPAALFFDGWSV